MDQEHVLDLYLIAYVVVAAVLAAVRWPPFFLAATMHTIVLLLAIARTSEGFAADGEQHLGLLQTLGVCKVKIEDSLGAVVAKLKQSQKAVDRAEATDMLITRDLYQRYRDPNMASTFPVDDDDRAFMLDAADAEDEGRFDAMLKEYALLDRWMTELPRGARDAIAQFVSSS